MKLVMLLWPHANVRYQNESLHLARTELRMILDCYAPDAQIDTYSLLDLPALQIDITDGENEALIAALQGHSLMYALFELDDNGAMRPMAARAAAYLGADLPGILKYKGKTNEIFLQLMLNAALYSGGFAHSVQKRLDILDPMCGRATTLFVAANRGWNATGTDLDRNDLNEAGKFLKRYFEFHRYKYTMKTGSRTVQGSAPAAESRFCFADTPEHFKAEDYSSLALVHGNAVQTRELFGREKFHMIVCDLPYGVQHAGVGGSTETLLTRALPGWRASLKKGGTVAVSFNAQTLKTEKVRLLMEESGLKPVICAGEEAGFRHWVEQAVTRDIVVGRREN